jgi:CheY-like chemotaxis protein
MNRNLLILVVEDDPNDVILLKKSFAKVGISNPVHICADGEEAIEYLQGCGPYSNRIEYPFPSVLISDLKMPRRTGLEVLGWLRENPKCRIVPVMIFSASREEKDVVKAYELGANAYIHKPSTFDELLNAVKMIHDFWKLCEKPPMPKD